MTYQTLHEIEAACGRTVAEGVARDYVAAEREHCVRVLAAMDEIAACESCGEPLCDRAIGLGGGKCCACEGWTECIECHPELDEENQTKGPT